jgi:CelD/BcsL family acetyltransferase involved in cellulose biosynthesis
MAPNDAVMARLNDVPMEASLRVRAYESLEEVEGILPAWDELLSRFPQATTFSTWEWLGSWWRAYGDGRRLRILGFFDTGERLAALAPLCLSTHGIYRTLGVRILGMMGDGTGDSDNLDFPVLPGYEEALSRALLGYLEARTDEWDVCQLNTMPDDSPAGNELLTQLTRRGWPHHVHRRPCAAIPLPETWESYLSRISGNERRKLGYYSRRLEKQHRVRFYKCRRADELAGCLEALFRLHEMRWATRREPGQLRFAARRRFYEEIGRLFLAKDWLEFWLLDLDGKPAAAQFGFRYRDAVFQLQEGYDPAHAAASVGFVLRGHVLKHLIAAGVRRYDFLGGTGPDKARFGAHLGTYLYVYFSPPGRRGRAALRLMQGIRQGKEWLRPRLKGVAWQVVSWLKFRLRGA